MRILVTGKYEPEYNRNLVLLRGLQARGIELIEFPYKKRGRQTRSRIIELVENCDLIFLPSFTHLDVPFVRRISKKPLVFDPLISRYLSKVFDYKAVWKYSPRALKNYLKDLRAFKRSDLLLADTLSHKEYYTERFGIDPKKIAVVHVGMHSGDFYQKVPLKKNESKIIIGFYGSFIPLHGIDKIISAAKLLEKRNDLEFRLYGDGTGFEKVQEQIKKFELKNVILEGWIEYHALNEAINSMDICLGIFGDSLKAELVIPNKIYHYAACGKPVITADTKGIKELFENEKDIELIENSAESLANSIIKLADNPEIREKIGKNACDLVTTGYNEKMIADEFLNAVKRIIAKEL